MMYYIYWLGTPDVLCLPVKYIGCIILLVTYTGCIVSTGHVPECEVYQPMRFTDIFADGRVYYAAVLCHGLHRLGNTYYSRNSSTAPLLLIRR